MATMIRRYSELCELVTFEERFEYLRLSGKVGVETFGYDRIFNQRFYNSAEWKRIRNFVISRDLGCDLGVEGYDIKSGIIIHHMNPIALADIINCTDILLNTEFLITTSLTTHNAIHYGDASHVARKLTERSPNDTCPWKKMLR